MTAILFVMNKDLKILKILSRQATKILLICYAQAIGTCGEKS